MDVATGLRQLGARLPLAERQAALPKHLRTLHTQTLQWFADHGSPPTAGDLGLDQRRWAASLSHLAQRDLFVVDGETIAGAYPFTMAVTPHLVSIEGIEVHAMCSLDALAIGPMFQRSTVIRSRCELTSTPIRIEMAQQTVVTADPTTVHIGLGLQDPRGCAATSLCKDIVFLWDAETARRWQGDAGDSTPILELDSAMELAGRFFAPLMQA